MKTKNMLWAVLSMTVALVMTACSNNDSANESPALQSTVKTVPYAVTVGQGEAATTRATVDGDLKTLKFAEGDKLYVSSETRSDLTGVLTLKSGDEGKSSEATFEGSLTYTGDEPAADLELKATLVDSSNVGIQIADDKVTGINYPTAAYCTDVNDAVEKYSNLTGTATYGAQSFSLTQQTAFLNFVITFEDGIASGTTLSAKVNNGGSAICTASVTTTTDESDKVVAKFVLPVAQGTTLSSATVTMGDKEAISFGASQTLDGKVYNVKKTQETAAATGHALTASIVGDIVGSDGLAYDAADKDNLPSGVTAVAMIAYVGSDAETNSTYRHGLALALKDASTGAKWCTQTSSTCLGSQYSSESAAKGDMAGIANTDALVNQPSHTHAAAIAARNYQYADGVTAGAHPEGTSSWFLPSAGQWDKMAAAAGGYANLKTNAALQPSGYWSSSVSDANSAWYFYTDDGYCYNDYKNSNFFVRACLTFCPI